MSNHLLTRRPPVGFFESFVLRSSRAIFRRAAPGGHIDFRLQVWAVHPSGLERSFQPVQTEQFRDAWAADACATLTAIGIGSDVRFGDKLHEAPFTSLLSRHTIDSLRHKLIETTEL